MAQEGKNEVLFLVRDRFYLYDGSAVLTLEFPANIVRDVDVKDRNGLHDLITSFIQNNKLIPAQIFFVLSEAVCFSKDFPIGGQGDAGKVEAETKEFIDEIPFSSVVSKVYKTPTTIRVVGSNQDLIDTIFGALEAKGFGISALIPANIFPDFGTAPDLNPETAQNILNKREAVIAASMVGERTVKEQQLATSQTAVPKNKLLPYLIGGFVLLLIILVAMIVMRG
jgi:hypothetical protein